MSSTDASAAADAPYFSLLDEPWIHVRDLAGSTREVSLRQVFREASTIREIAGELPTQGFAILRVLLVILHRATADEAGNPGPRDVGHWKALIENWVATCDEIDDYLAHFADHFYLFHPRTPFMQVADLRTEKGEIKDLAPLISDMPNGEQFFVQRRRESVESLSMSEAARWVVHAQAFDPSGIKSAAVGDPRTKGGKGYPIGQGWGGHIGGIQIQGQSLMDTLALNLVAFAKVGITSGPNDVPAWERAPFTACEEVPGGRAPFGPLDLYTWQVRRIRLHRVANVVTGVVLANGDQIKPQNMHPFEPMTAWRYSKPQSTKFKTVVYMPQEFRIDRSAWKGATSLLAPDHDAPVGKEPSEFKSSALLRWVAQLRDHSDRVPAHMVVRATGFIYGSQSAVYSELIDDRWQIPSALACDTQGTLYQRVVDAAAKADSGVQLLSTLIKNLALASGAGRDATDALWGASRARAFAAFDRPFRQWLSSLTVQETPEQSAQRWVDQVRAQLERTAADLIGEAGPNAMAGRVVSTVSGDRLFDLGIADRWFHAGLRKEFAGTGASGAASGE